MVRHSRSSYWLAIINRRGFECYLISVSFCYGDRTTTRRYYPITVDAIVNAANTSLLGGGGVDGAIHRAGGKEILEECKLIRARQGGCPTGEAVITTAGKLQAKKVIHTVGPVWNGGTSDEANQLRSCYLNAIKLAEAHEFEVNCLS